MTLYFYCIYSEWPFYSFVQRWKDFQVRDPFNTFLSWWISKNMEQTHTCSLDKNISIYIFLFSSGSLWAGDSPLERDTASSVLAGAVVRHDLSPLSVGISGSAPPVAPNDMEVLSNLYGSGKKTIITTSQNTVEPS